MTEPQIQQRHEQPYLGIRSEVPAGRIRAVVDRAFPQLFRWLGERGIQPSGPPFIRYYEVDEAGEPREIESAAPVADRGAAPDEGPVRAGVLPAGRYVTVLHVGPYTHDSEPDLTDARAALKDWTEANEIVCSRPSDRGELLPCYAEHYRIGPPMEADWTKWENELVYLIVEG
jgi:RNA polymerase sigma-70 factor, ECF subfamily